DSESPGFRSELTRAWTVGQRIGRYQLGKPLGRGGMGVVYVADDELLGRVVALKVLREDRTGSVALSRVLREAQSLARLSHPNVVQVYDISTYNGQIFIAMEFIAGGTLRQWLDAETRSFDTILEVFLQAGRGLAAAHNVGIIHRDFKPDNVLIGADGRARVADFGLAAEQPQFASNVTVTSEDDERLTRAGTILGTPRYMSPEHREGGNLDARADQFSFCVALYEALYAAHPFPEVGAAATPPKGEGLWVWPLLKRGLQPRPDDRFSGLLELLAALERNPALLRKRRLRLAGFLLLSVAIAAALTLGGLNVAQRWQAAALEDEAARAYASAEERIERAIHAGHNEEAERIFRAFVEEPIYGETQVVSQAWLARAKRRAKARDLDGARAAAAYAYTHGKTPAQRRSALLVLGRVFERDFDWAGLSELLNLLDREGLTTADEGEYQRLRGAATFGQRELATAAQLDVGPARALAGATSTPYHVIARTEEVEVEGEPLLLLMSFEGGYVTIYAVSATPELDERWRHEFGYLPRVIVAGKRPFLIAGRGGGEPLNTLYEVHKDGLVEVSKFEGAPPTCAALSDLDGDGEDELYFSTGLDLEVARIDLLHPGASAPHVVVDTRGTL
ncbi:MAG: serine/threonine-protein kinase, partial [Nannocystaceae bacterium]